MLRKREKGVVGPWEVLVVALVLAFVGFVVWRVTSTNETTDAAPALAITSPVEGESFVYGDDGVEFHFVGVVTPGSTLTIEIGNPNDISESYEYFSSDNPGITNPIQTDGSFDFNYEFMSWNGPEDPEHELTFTATSPSGDVTEESILVEIVPEQFLPD